MELPTIFDPATCVRKGLCSVTALRAEKQLESHSLYYEQHGKGIGCKILLIMGLNSSSFGWAPQVRHFGRSDEYTVLVFDNRGVGNSGYPLGPYTTKSMAADTVTLLDHVGWTAEHDVHVVGISLGGMIAQELATMIPNRIASLVLAVTTPGGRPWNNFPPWKGLSSLARLAFITDPVKKVPIVLDMLFPSMWLDAKAEDDSEGRTNRQVQTEAFLRRATLTLPQGFLGHVSQMAAGLTHYCSPDRLRQISASIPKVTLLTGDEDNLVSPEHSKELKSHMPEAELIEWQQTGHAIHSQREKWFNELLERTFKEGSDKAKLKKTL